MICDNCKKYQATIQLEQIINNEKIEMNICQKCSLDFSTPIFFNSVIQGILFNLQSSGNNVDTITCAACGLNLAEFKKFGKLGCSNCYKDFEVELMALYKNIQYGTEHVGKFPKKSAKSLIALKEIKKLKTRLKVAIAEEEFEEAAKLRDKIKSLEEEAKNNVV